MKRFVKIFFGFILVLFLAGILVPILFKDKIRELIITEFENSTEATVYFDIDEFSLSLIKNFPDFTVGLGGFGVVGKGVFEGDTLVSVNELEARINLSDVLFGESISIKGVDLESPSFMIIALADGTANYDIAKPSDTPAPVADEEASSVSFGIESFSISNGDFVYFDQSSKVLMDLTGVNLSGRGDFAEDIFDLISKGSVDAVNLNYDGTQYVSDKALDLDMVLSMDLPNSTYTFKENTFAINDFPLHLDGSFSMLEGGYGMDISFDSPSSEFKKILSLVPGVYTEQFKDITADGSAAFKGKVSGTYSEETMPAFNLALDITDGRFQYPGLSESINDVQLHLAVDNKDGVIENTLVDLKQMHVKFGKNPFDASFRVANLKDFPVKAAIKGKINLADLNKMIPMEGFSMAGDLQIDAKADGKYDSLRSMIPAMDLQVILKDGVINSAEISKPLEQLNVSLKVNNTSGRLSDTKIVMDQMSFMLDGQPFEANLKLENPDNFAWDANVTGQIDLEKLFQIYPMEGVAAKGLINADLHSTGNMADLEAKRYRELSAKGNVSVTDFAYDYAEMNKTFSISKANTSFSDRSIDLKEFEGKAGETSYSLTGKLNNYLGFFLNDEVLTGSLTANADRLNVNEWMTEGSEEEVESSGEPLEVVRIPENVEFTVNTTVDQVTYNKLNLDDLKGRLLVKDGKIDLNNTDFKALNGTIKLNGAYDSKPEQPTFDFGFKVKEVSIPASFQSVDMVQRMAPVTEKMTGLFSTDFSLKGALGSDMMPDYATLTGGGLIQILEASLGGDSNLLSGLGGVSKLTKVGTATLEKVKMSAEVKDGRLFVKPFNVKVGDYKTVVSGSTGIDGSIDYVLQMDVPAGKVGNQLNGLVSSLTGNSFTSGSNLKLNIGLGNTFTDPKFNLRSVGTGDGQTVKGAVTASVKEKVEEKKEEVKAQAEEKVAELKDSAQAVVNTQTAALKDTASLVLKAQKDSVAAKLADKLGVKKDSTDKLGEKAHDLLKGFFKKKKKKKKDTDKKGGN